MEYSVSSLSVPSSDGIHTLSGVVYEPKGEIKGIFHLVHGMTEYIGRYSHLFEYLAEQGFVVFGYDNLGHGKTVRDNSELGFIADKNGYDYLVQDVAVAEAEVLLHYPDKPLYLMGHSMGSFIARLAAKRYNGRYSALIICGTGGPNPLSLAGLAICKIQSVVLGKHHISPFCEWLAFGAYNRRFERISKYDWLTKDRIIIKQYEQDKYCNFHFTVSALYDLIKLNSLANKKSAHKIDKDLPILIISGDLDPVGNYGKGVRAVAANYRKARIENVTLKLYENCRHEIHNDSCKAEMFDNIQAFLANITKI